LIILTNNANIAQHRATSRSIAQHRATSRNARVTKKLVFYVNKSKLYSLPGLYGPGWDSEWFGPKFEKI